VSQTQRGAAPEDPASLGSGMMSRSRRLLLGLGLALVVGALVADPLRGRPMELGAVQLVFIAVGGLLAAVMLGGARPFVRRGLLAAAATYGTLVGLELLLGLLEPSRITKNPLAGLRGMSIEDPAVGYRLDPSWHGHYDDGVVQAEYRTNARGDRDDEAPLATASRRVLLLGDSFAFGQGLPRADTIEARIEAASGGDVDAYTLGVPGYSTVHVLRRFEQSTWWRGQDVVYLFFGDDVHPAQHALDYMRVVDGHVVQRRRADGREYAQAELDERLARALADDPEGLTAQLGERLGLERLRGRLASSCDSELRLTGLPIDELDRGIVEQAVAHVQSMARLAAERGARFHVVIIPTKGELTERTFSQGTVAFIAAARAAAIDPDEGLLAALEQDDYFAHDGHFAAAGSEVVAARVLGILQRDAT
jgi:hypothetical protein